MRRFAVLFTLLLVLSHSLPARGEAPESIAASGPTAEAQRARQALLREARRIVFLGDSITANGQYVAFFDAWLQTLDLEHPPEVLNLGLSSETVSGLSEMGHAGGKFPRPDLHERLDRVLAKTEPDLVFACYGMNCGIYQPFDSERFARYQQGMKRLKAALEARGAKLVLITPPCYDAAAGEPNDFYDGVLARYGEWIVEQAPASWQAIDLHTPMAREAERRRKLGREHRFTGDRVHPNAAGHWFIARTLIGWFGDAEAAAADSPAAMLASQGADQQLLPLVHQRMTTLRDAYVAAAGHQRPGVAKGLPLEEARIRAEKLTEQIDPLRQR